ncbi:hypothetical protein GGQ97_000015 [Sphingomonas kaistensis]|uniref:YchF C-terminal domain-containing protein n=1 Tax=Sphingomonas kaistensis TaxID=298708 RepID=A0A7X6BFR4_9SPHN|nr:hypothetical protein [Sphingomonas kaistensis]
MILPFHMVRQARTATLHGLPARSTPTSSAASSAQKPSPSTIYVALGGEAGARNAGKLRQETKEYVVADGDVLHFKFNV